MRFCALRKCLWLNHFFWIQNGGPVHDSVTEYSWFLKNCGLTEQEIHWVLDEGQMSDEQVQFVLSLRDGHFMSRLFQLAELKTARLGLNDLCPEGQSVVMEGRNSLPAFTRFAKVFYHPPGQNVLYGYNRTTIAPLIGPGYFVVDPLTNGGVLIDYDKLPPMQPQGFPALRGNDSGIAALVNGGLKDATYAVTRNVWIGRATKNGKGMGYFILARSPVSA